MFFKEVSEVDLGETSIANIFIDIYMPMANGLYTQVYLLAYRNVCNPGFNPKFNNESIAKDLNIPLSDVISAWKFWESKGLVKMHKNEGLEDFDYSIEFLDLKKLYADNILINTPSIKSNSDRIVDTSSDPNIRRMFNTINQIVGRYLEPGEKLSIMEIMDKYNMSPDMILCAYEHVKDKYGSSRPVKYIEGIIRNWYDANLYTPQDVKDSFAVRSERYMLYRTIFNELGFSRNPSRAEKEDMDRWIDKFNMDIELILQACSKAKNVSNPSITFINGVIKKWNDKNVKTLDDLKLYEEEYNKKKADEKKSSSVTNNKKGAVPTVKTRFHNINQTFNKYSPDELEKILQESQRDKFK
ncbi:DnaD domain protein [[Clostridium] dakarense]|uniref:DnaD domain protein n=1 Tax=Faecalimicrobium dakarense TaxID=1301100 RepID=UPI0004B0EAB6|nr:DnaD domain protein [[Clostridium] dakarense]